MGICFNEAGISPKVEGLKKERCFQNHLPPRETTCRDPVLIQRCRVSQCSSCQRITHRYQLRLQDPWLT